MNVHAQCHVDIFCKIGNSQRCSGVGWCEFGLLQADLRLHSPDTHKICIGERCSLRLHNALLQSKYITSQRLTLTVRLMLLLMGHLQRWPKSVLNTLLLFLRPLRVRGHIHYTSKLADLSNLRQKKSIDITLITALYNLSAMFIKPWPSLLKNVCRRGVLIAEEIGWSAELGRGSPRLGSETAAPMGEYGSHFKMKNGKAAQCHLINVKPQQGEGTTACGGHAVPGLMSLRRRGVLNEPTFTA